MTDGGSEASTHRVRDGRAWRIGTAADIEWIQQGTGIGLPITSGIPPVFTAYATVVLPTAGLPDSEEEQDRRELAMLEVLIEHSAGRSWWLGYLDTGASDVVFPDAPMVPLYAGGWWYVLVEAGPQQASHWRERDPWKGVLPDLIFPADRSWLISTLWDDDWTCVGGSDELVSSLLNHPELHARARQVTVDEDATPPGHQAR
jgi:hypothetical protein